MNAELTPSFEGAREAGDVETQRSLAGVLEHLRDGIVNRRYPPGSHLRERDLAGQLGVSRACVREALGVLVERRLVVRFPNRGVEVVRLGRAEIVSIYEAREYLDGCAVGSQRNARRRGAGRTWSGCSASRPSAPSPRATLRYICPIPIG